MKTQLLKLLDNAKKLEKKWNSKSFDDCNSHQDSIKLLHKQEASTRLRRELEACIGHFNIIES